MENNKQFVPSPEIRDAANLKNNISLPKYFTNSVVDFHDMFGVKYPYELIITEDIDHEVVQPKMIDNDQRGNG